MHMKLNQKGIIIKAANLENLGRVITTINFIGDMQHPPQSNVWAVEGEDGRPFVAQLKDSATGDVIEDRCYLSIVQVADENLRPLTGLDDPDSDNEELFLPYHNREELQAA